MRLSEAKKICEKWLESVSEISIRWFLGSARERNYFSPVLDMDDAGIISDVEMEKTFDGGIGVLSIYARRVDLDNFQNPDRFCVFHYDLTNDSRDNLLASEQAVYRALAGKPMGFIKAKILRSYEYHHTSSWYNTTDYYEFDPFAGMM